MDPAWSFTPPIQCAKNPRCARSCHPGLSASPSVHLILPQDLDTGCFLYVKYFCVSYLQASTHQVIHLSAQMAVESFCLLTGSTEFTVPLGTHLSDRHISTAYSPPRPGFLCELAHGLKYKLHKHCFSSPLATGSLGKGGGACLCLSATVLQLLGE